MLFRDVVELVALTTGENTVGDAVETEAAPRQVFANKKSVRQSEFYQAAATGLKPEIMFEVRTIDYLDERKLRHNGKTFEVIRVFSKNDEITELICSGLVVATNADNESS